MNQPPNLKILTELLIEELAGAVGLKGNSIARAAIRGLAGKAARKFSQLALDLDREVGAGGVSGGARWVLPRFAASCEIRGTEHIPPKGPLVIAANHPGSFDSVAISAHVARPDYKVIIGDIPFFENLPNIRAQAIFAPAMENVAGRMRVVRECVRHLQAGGSLLIFARGGIEADPDCMPDPGAEFHLWSRSLEIFLRQVPRTRILVTVVSGVIARSAFRHPLTWFRTARPDRQRLAFMYQFIRQMLSGWEVFGLTPRVTFGELLAGANREHVLAEVAAAATRTLQTHQAWEAG